MENNTLFSIMKQYNSKASLYTQPGTAMLHINY